MICEIGEIATRLRRPIKNIAAVHWQKSRPRVKTAFSRWQTLIKLAMEMHRSGQQPSPLHTAPLRDSSRSGKTAFHQGGEQFQFQGHGRWTRSRVVLLAPRSERTTSHFPRNQKEQRAPRALHTVGHNLLSVAISKPLGRSNFSLLLRDVLSTTQNRTRLRERERFWKDQIQSLV